MNHRAQLDKIGNWGGQEQEAVDCWNYYVATELNALERYDEEVAYHVAACAWELFCDTTNSESWAELGQRVASYVRQ